MIRGCKYSCWYCTVCARVTRRNMSTGKEMNIEFLNFFITTLYIRNVLKQPKPHIMRLSHFSKNVVRQDHNSNTPFKILDLCKTLNENCCSECIQPKRENETCFRGHKQFDKYLSFSISANLIPLFWTNPRKLISSPASQSTVIEITQVPFCFK